MKKLLLHFLLFYLINFSNSVKSQDIHFSMFYASPLTLNPAFAGVNEGDYRIAGIYRDQWRSVIVPFQTGAASFDMRILKKYTKKDIFGIGGNFVFDKAGQSSYKTLLGNLFLSYHKSIDKNGKHFIGLGIGLGYQQESFNPNGLIFPSQHLGDDFDPSAPNNENNLKTNTGGFDMNAGLLHQSTISDRVGIISGVTVHHLVFPKRSYLGNDYRIKPRINANLGVRVRIYKGFSIVPAALYQYQNKAQEFNFGGALEYKLPVGKTNLIASVGGWYRLKDAGIITAGIEVYSVKVMAAYDFNTSQLRPASRGNGAFEVAAIFTGIIKKKSNQYPILVPCPMM